VLRKHKNNTTVAIEVLHFRFIKENRTCKLSVRWWNISTRNPPRPMAIEQKFTIGLEAWSDWEPYHYGVSLETIVEEPTET